MVVVKDDALEKSIISAGYNLSQFAKKCGKSKTSIYNVLKRKKVSPEYASTICDVLNADFDDFFILSSCTKGH